jgi:hypothetical protein
VEESYVFQVMRHAMGLDETKANSAPKKRGIFIPDTKSGE